MTLTLEVSPETVSRVERARIQGVNIETLLCRALEHFDSLPNQAPPTSHPLDELAGKYEGDAWEELLVKIEQSRNEE